MLGLWRVAKSKAEAGCREIVSNGEARVAFGPMFGMAEALGELKPEHFIFSAVRIAASTIPVRRSRWLLHGAR